MNCWTVSKISTQSTKSHEGGLLCWHKEGYFQWCRISVYRRASYYA